MTDNNGNEKATHPESTPTPQPGAAVPAPSVSATPSPAATAAPRPGGPRRKPESPKPHAMPGPAAAHPHPVVVPSVSDPSQWGRVDEDGTAWVKSADGERVIGSWQAGDAAEGLAHFGRRYDDLATEFSLLYS
ncbi:DUF349 domain-containing protein, partial [Nocardia tengchongensis]